MIQEYKKLFVISGIAFVMFALLVLFVFVDISLGPIQICSISTILSQFNEVTTAEDDLLAKQNTYNTTLTSLERAKTSYQTEKDKYEAISDETIEVIKEATMQEEYSIEYMWVRLGNYAKVNNLEIVLVEPGGGQLTDTSQSTNNTTTNTPVAKSNTTTTTSSNTANNSTRATDNIATDVKNADVSLSDAGNQGGMFKIQVSGSYMNVSDFVFAVENDNELRFKLDNISMEYVAGTTIKATFDVKNMIILK